MNEFVTIFKTHSHVEASIVRGLLDRVLARLAATL